MENNHVSHRLRLGVAYYPEQWPESRWELDAELMERAGITTVRLAEFAWHKFEPVEGKYEFAWLDRALDMLARHGLSAILCTPTPTYPAWLHRKEPGIHQVRSNGQIKEFGQRQDACKNHPGYRERALRITDAVTKHFGHHPSVVAWQTDNELGCHGTARCYCAYCERAFQSWLSHRFQDIDRLNDAWGTAFWSQQYNLFSEVSLPRDTADRSGSAGQNPALLLDFFRFCSDVQVSFNRELVSIVRANSPSRIITHNLMASFTDIDYFNLARDLDVVSWDNYPFFQPQTYHLPPFAMPHDLMRGLKKRNVWVMEQASGPGGWDRFYPTPEPGRMRLWAFQAIARGADFISFFRWRTARFGTEQYWHGLLPHDGQPGSRYKELTRLAAEVKALSSEIEGSRVAADVAIVYDYDSLWALEIQPHSLAGISYDELARNYAAALARLGIVADIVSAGEDFRSFKLLIAPSQHVSDSQFADKLREYVREGGIAVIGARSCVKDRENAVHDEALPAGIRDLIGGRIDDYDCFSHLADDAVEVVSSSGARFSALHLAELIAPDTGTSVELTYEGRYYSGRAAALRNPFGQGVSYYLGTYLDAQGLEAFLREPLHESGIPTIEGLDPAVEVCARCSPGATYRFYLNHDANGKTVRLVSPGREMITGAKVAGMLALEALGVAVVQEE
ncbi:MAG: beta-galactosidase [Spirochaetia bacterium]|jgi:beta-galactosidase